MTAVLAHLTALSLPPSPPPPDPESQTSPFPPSTSDLPPSDTLRFVLSTLSRALPLHPAALADPTTTAAYATALRTAPEPTVRAALTSLAATLLALPALPERPIKDVLLRICLVGLADVDPGVAHRAATTLARSEYVLSRPDVVQHILTHFKDSANPRSPTSGDGMTTTSTSTSTSTSTASDTTVAPSVLEARILDVMMGLAQEGYAEMVAQYGYFDAMCAGIGMDVGRADEPSREKEKEEGARATMMNAAAAELPDTLSLLATWSLLRATVEDTATPDQVGVGTTTYDSLV